MQGFCCLSLLAGQKFPLLEAMGEGWACMRRAMTGGGEEREKKGRRRGKREER